MAIRHKRKNSANYTWLSGDLVEGQIGLNIADGSLHFKLANGTIVSLKSLIRNSEVASDAAIDWSKISKAGAAANDVGAVPTTRAINTGTGIGGGGDLSQNRTIRLSNASIDSLALADTALQPGAIGVTVQGFDGDLAAIAGLTTTGAIERTGDGTAATYTVSSFAKTFLDDADAAAVRTTIDAAQSAHTHPYQPLDNELTAIAGLTSAANTLPYFTGSATAALTTLSAFGRSLIDDADAATARTTLGTAASATSISAGTGLSGGGDLSASRTLSLSTATQTSLGKADTSLQPGAIGTTVQGYDAELAALSGLVSAADRLPYFTGSGTAALATFTAFGRSLIDDADAATARTTLGAAASSHTHPYQPLDADLTSIAGLTTTGFLERTAADTYNHFAISTFCKTFLGETSAEGVRLSLAAQASDEDLSAIAAINSTGLIERTGSAAFATTPITSYIKTLLDDADAVAARTTLGLGTAATQSQAFLLDRANHTGVRGVISDDLYLSVHRCSTYTANSNTLRYLLEVDGRTRQMTWGTNSFNIMVDSTNVQIQTNLSDVRLKKNIAQIDIDALREDQSALSLFAQAELIEFDWDESKCPLSGHVKVGFSAQQLYSISPELVIGDPTTAPIEHPVSINVSNLLPWIVLAIKELSQHRGAKATKLQKFKRSFSAPGNLLYASIFSKVKAANDHDVFDHWANFKMAIFDADERGVVLGVQRLKQLLELAGHSISQADISGSIANGDSHDGWNTLCSQAGIADLSWQGIPILIS